MFFGSISASITRLVIDSATLAGVVGTFYNELAAFGTFYDELAVVGTFCNEFASFGSISAAFRRHFWRFRRVSAGLGGISAVFAAFRQHFGGVVGGRAGGEGGNRVRGSGRGGRK